ncbi:MAG: C40 family peptidase [Deltaproteobacteria bacterium]|nr:C40 family peptidase [Deltaproteobacteria bacterium]
MTTYGDGYRFSKFRPPPGYLLSACLVLIFFLITTGCSGLNINNRPGITGITASQTIEDNNDSLANTPADTNSIEDNLKDKGLTQKILATAYTQWGKPYRFGGNSPQTGFDCAGFVQWVYAQHGIKLPRMSTEQIRVGTPVTKSDLRPGDLVFYYEMRSVHVGLYAGNGKFIDSPRTGFRIGEMEAFDAYHAACFAGARRFINDSKPQPLDDKLRESIIAKALSINAPGFKQVNTTMVAKAPVKRPDKTTVAMVDTSRGSSTKSQSLTGRNNQRTSQTAVAANTADKKSKSTSVAAAASSKTQTTAMAQASNNHRHTEGRNSHYQVKNGDTIVTVAQRLKVPYQSLLQANGLAQNHTLRIGQLLNVPGNSRQ